MSVTCTNLKQFTEALRSVARASKKDEADIVNKALKDVAFRAASFTPKATTIGPELNKQLLSRLAAKSLGGNFTRAQLKERMTAILRRRKAGIGALRAGWIPAIQALGGSYRGARLRAGGSAAQGIARRATISQLSGLIRNSVTTSNNAGKSFSADQIALAVNALNKAVTFVTADRLRYAKAKIEATLHKYSDK